MSQGIIKLLAVIICVLLGVIGYQAMTLRQTREKLYSAEELPQDVSVRVQEKGRQLVVRTQKDTKVLTKPRMGEAKIDVKDDGTIVASNPWVSVGAVPNIGVVYHGELEPSIGIQIVRQEDMGLGLGVDATPTMVGISLSKDVWDNSAVGIFYAKDSVGVKFSLFL